MTKYISPQESGMTTYAKLNKAIDSNNAKKVHDCLTALANIGFDFGTIEFVHKSEGTGTSLHLAAMGRSPQIVEMLLQCTGNKEGLINHPSGAGGNTPLHLAAQRNSLDIMNVLRENGARADIQNEQGETAAEITASHPENTEHANRYFAQKANGRSIER